MTKQEAAIVSAYTGFLLGEFGEFHAYAEQLLERPVFTHEFGSEEFSKLIRAKVKEAFITLKVE